MSSGRLVSTPHGTFPLPSVVLSAIRRHEVGHKDLAKMAITYLQMAGAKAVQLRNMGTNKKLKLFSKNAKNRAAITKAFDSSVAAAMVLADYAGYNTWRPQNNTQSHSVMNTISTTRSAHINTKNNVGGLARQTSLGTRRSTSSGSSRSAGSKSTSLQSNKSVTNKRYMNINSAKAVA